MIRLLFILNDAPYGSERSYDLLRLAGLLARKPQAELRLFLMGDSVLCAKSGQVTPQGAPNLEAMFKPILGNKAVVAACSTCMEERGLTKDMLIDGVAKGTWDELADWILWCDRIVDL